MGSGHPTAAARKLWVELAQLGAPAYTCARKMRTFERALRVTGVLGIFGLASFFTLWRGTGSLWRGLEIAHAVTSSGKSSAPYDLTQLVAVHETLSTIRSKYVDPPRIKPRQMFLSALNEVQKDVAQVIVRYTEKSPTVRVQIETESKEFRVDNVQAIWDVAARLREVFVFLNEHLKKDPELDLREVEYAACNGILRTLDPHSVFLSPEAYREMNMSTSGHFGGLGIVISIRDQQLTVMRPMPDTPAGRAGLKRYDRITKINNESTLNMPLDDAVNRLRGKAGSHVTVWVHRDGTEGWNGSRPFTLVREEIRIRSADSRALGDGVGYVRIKQFQTTTAEELQSALVTLSRPNRLRALVLDLRGNPGGLLEQAARVADLFLEEGVIVSTIGEHEGREEKKASRDGNEPDYPVIVLTNGSSASASEIVAGALKNQDRAIVVGQTTFGKGTVQLVFPRVTPDGAALKLTIAQYLTPGNVSIQGVGVTPDIELDPMTADPLEMDIYRVESLTRERDLSKSLSSEGRRNTDRPAFNLRYDLPEAQRARMRELGGEIDDEFTLDFAVQFAKELSLAVTGTKRPDQLRSVKHFLEKKQQQQMTTIGAELSKMGVDFSPPPADFKNGPTTRDFAVRVKTDRKNDTVQAGEPMMLDVEVENRSSSPVYRLRGMTKSDSGYFDEKELVFGRIEPGKSRTVRVPLGWCQVEGRKSATTKPLPDNAKRSCVIPLDAVTRQDVVKIQFFAEGSEAPPSAEFRPTTLALKRPVFAYSYQIADNRPGNGDGQLRRGEGATVYLGVKNVGTGSSHDTQALLRNLTGDGLLLQAGRFDISNMNPGDERQVALTFDVLQGLEDDAIKLDLSIADRDLRVASNAKLVIPVAPADTKVEGASGRMLAADGARIFSQPAPEAPYIGDLEKGAVVERLGQARGFTQIRLVAERTGWVPSAALAPAANRPLAVRFKTALRHSPPLLEITPTQLATTADKVHVKGVASDTDRVLDVFVFVGTRKVFYQSNRNAADAKRLAFELDAELNPGINLVTVVARENHDTLTRTNIAVRRDGPGGVPLPTPKSTLFGDDWDFGDTD
jgi:carboxyl-terminal processing protease